MPFTSRLEKLIKGFRGLDALLVTDIHNVRYLTGFTGSSGFVLATTNGTVFVTDFRYREQAANELSSEPTKVSGVPGLAGQPLGMAVVIENRPLPKVVRGLVRRLGVSRLGVEASISYEMFVEIERLVPGARATSGAVERLRMTKDEQELSLIREAVRRAEAAFAAVRPYVRPGASEMAISLRLEERLKKEGSKRVPFDIIVASGPNSALPHASATKRKLKAGDLVTIDWGGEAGGYFSDITRTLLLKGGHQARQKEIYSLVLEANRRARALVGPGRGARDIDAAARDHIGRNGYGEYFGHGLGHGVGLQVHEAPRISWRNKARVRQGMVFTIEPGIYVPGLGGVRIEDMVVVNDAGSELLTSLPRGLENI